MGGAAVPRVDEQAAVGGDARGAQSQLGPEEGWVARAEELALYAGTPAAQRAPIAALRAELRAMNVVELGMELRAVGRDTKEEAGIEEL